MILLRNITKNVFHICAGKREMHGQNKNAERFNVKEAAAQEVLSFFFASTYCFRNEDFEDLPSLFSLKFNLFFSVG